MANLDYLGKGEYFPLTPNANGGVKLIAGVELLKQSMLDILITQKGTRAFNEEYGSYIYMLRFTPNDAVLNRLLKYHIAQAISQWEKRVKVTQVSCVQNGEAQTDCHITFRILASNEIDSFVFPFYKEIKT